MVTPDAARAAMEAWYRACPHGLQVIVEPGARLAWFCVPCLTDLFARLGRMESRERFFAEALGIPDSGQYRNDWSRRLTTIMAENARLREALEKYGAHSSDLCSLRDEGRTGECDCGLDAALAGTGDSDGE